MEFTQKRWIALAACMLSAIFNGVIYSWSVYVNPLVAKYGWDLEETSLAYTINVVVAVATPLLSAGLRSRLSLRAYCLLGTLAYGAGITLCGFIQGSVWELYLYFGVLTGAGIGFVYVRLATYVVQLFPDRRGTAAALYTASYGLAAFFWSPAARHIMDATGDVSYAFIYLGILFSVVIALCHCFFYRIPEQWAGLPSKSNTQTAWRRAAVSSEKTPHQVLRSPIYYVVLIMYICAQTSGTMVMSLGAPILESSLSYSPEHAALVVGFFAVASTSGRLLCGLLTDRLGGVNVLLLITLAVFPAMLLLSQVNEESLFLCCLLVIPLCYGGYACIQPPVTVETFGSRHFVDNYNLLFVSVGFASLVGPKIIAHVKISSGSYQDAFFYGSVFAFSALILALIFKLWTAAQEKKRLMRGRRPE